MRRIGIVLPGLLLLITPVALAATIKVPKDEGTIQAAIDAADSGDSIAVSKGSYDEEVVIDGKTDLTIKGKGKPTVTSFSILGSDDIEVSGFQVKDSVGHGAFIFESTDIIIRKCIFRRTGDDAIRADSCDRILVEKNRFDDIGESGVSLSGGREDVTTDNSTVSKNRFKKIGDTAIVVNGSDNLIEKNRTFDCGDDGYSIEAGNIEGEEPSTRNRLIKNRVTKTGKGGFDVRASGNTLEKNTSVNVHDDAFTLFNANDNTLVKNNAKNPRETGYQVDGDRNRFEKNKVSGAGEDGFVLQTGTGNEFEKNQARKSADSGFKVEDSGNTFTKNKAKKSGDFDLEDIAGGNTYSGNNFKTRSVP